jgi:hypothetical protein
VEVTIRGVHFKDGLANDYGGAVYNGGTLTLESCIFSGNRTITYSGGAIWSGNTLTIRGCTFYGNVAGANGGAVCFTASGKTLTLEGNLFYGNTGGNYPVVNSSGTVSASYNVVDAAFGTGTTDSGWTAGTGDNQAMVLPLSPRTFKILYGNAAAATLPSTLPTGYPATDFYGQSISAGGAAGAVQAVTANGYWLDLLPVNNSLWGSVSVNPLPDADGLVSSGSVTLTAISGTYPYSFAYWLQEGVKITSNPYTFTISAHTQIQAVFGIEVNTFSGAGSDATPGTLRYALVNAQDGDIIWFNGVSPGATVLELEGPLPEITKSVTIEGEGITLAPVASWIANDTSQLFRISGAVTIRRVHFKDGLANGSGGAIRNAGTLTLESCIFSGNKYTGASGGGGAIYSSDTLTIRGCTFYGNTAPGVGAVFFSVLGKTLTLTGNLFYGNTGNYPVVLINGSRSASYNMVDVAYGQGATWAGWDAGTGDLYSAAMSVSPKTFKVLYGNAAATNLPSTLPSGYPTTDFYGQPISGGGAAGAVQAVTAASGYYLGLSVNNSSAGTVSVNSQPDGDDLYPGGSVITATPNTGWSLWYWLVDGVKTIAPSLTLSAHTRIQAVFCRSVTVFTDGAGSESTPGTLRYALTNAGSGDTIVFSGVTPGDTTITLESPLPQITESVTMEGNGVILTRASSWTSNATSQLLYITSDTAELRITGVHFKDGLAFNYGSAIRSEGPLTLESCIFSGCTTTYNFGAAVYSANTLTIRGCTFYGNTTSIGGSGAVYYNPPSNYEFLTMRGNLFYGNSSPVVYQKANFSGSYNVVDMAIGTGSGQSGWYPSTGDTTFSALSITGVPFNTTTFAPVSALQSVLPSAPAGFPETDFYGNTRTDPGAPGAVR